MEKVDRRISRTRRLLGDALVALILEKGYNAITIRDITDRADVAYATFFRHFDGKEDLLAHLMEGIIAKLAALAGKEQQRHLEAEGLLFFQHVAENQTLYRSLLSSQGSRQVAQRLKEAIAVHIRAAAGSHYQAIDDPAVPFDIVLNHIAASALELIAWWLEHNMPYPPEEMALIYDRLIIQATWHIIPRENEAKLPPGFHQSG
jgi:AcrR family transcriptional regulator